MGLLCAQNSWIHFKWHFSHQKFKQSITFTSVLDKVGCIDCAKKGKQYQQPLRDEYITGAVCDRESGGTDISSGSGWFQWRALYTALAGDWKNLSIN